MNFIQLEPASLTIGYVCGTLLCYYIMEMFHAKESEYEREQWKDKPEEPSPHYGNSPYPRDYPYNMPTSNGK